MSILLEQILNGDYVSANELFEERMLELQERKLYEAKRMMQAEAFGVLKFTKAEIEEKKRQGYRRASEVLGDPSKKMKPLVKLKKKKVTEAVDVQPDPESRVRGGKAKPAKGTMKRNIMAAVARGIRKTARAAGTAAGNVAVAAHRAREASSQSTSPFPSDMHKTQTTQTTDKKEPGWIKRNVNTLLGREPDYDKSTLTQNDKIKQSGRAGKMVRSFAGRLASAAHETWE